MPVVLFILAAVLVLFGGGCTLVVLVNTIQDPRAMYADIGIILGLWVPLGLAPLAVGVALWRAAHNMKRRRPEHAAAPGDEKKP